MPTDTLSKWLIPPLHWSERRQWVCWPMGSPTETITATTDRIPGGIMEVITVVAVTGTGDIIVPPIIVPMAGTTDITIDRPPLAQWLNMNSLEFSKAQNKSSRISLDCFGSAAMDSSTGFTSSSLGGRVKQR